MLPSGGQFVFIKDYYVLEKSIFILVLLVGDKGRLQRDVSGGYHTSFRALDVDAHPDPSVSSPGFVVTRTCQRLE